MGSNLLTLRQATEPLGLSQTTLERLGQVGHHCLERPSTPTDLGGEDSPPHPTESQAGLRFLKRCLVDLASNHVLSWEVVAAVFQLIPELKEV